MASYIGVISKNKHGEYCVSFPDFHGCVTAGSTIEEAKQMATEALNLHVEGMLEDGEKIPVALSLHNITSNPDYKKCFAFVQVEVPEAKPKTIRINITIPENTLKHIDNAAKRTGFSRSAFLIHAAQNAIRTGQVGRKYNK